MGRPAGDNDPLGPDRKKVPRRMDGTRNEPTPHHAKEIVVRKLRRGDDEGAMSEAEHAAMTPAERIGHSWEITQALYRMRGVDVSAERLDRTVTRIQRGRS